MRTLQDRIKLFLFCMLSVFMMAHYWGCSTGENGGNSASPHEPSPELIRQGEQLYLTLGCAQCHTKDGKRLLAPTFKGLYGKEEKLSDGSTVIVNPEYIKESILHPDAKIVAGYQPMHPPQTWKLDEGQIDALIAFIYSLKD